MTARFKALAAVVACMFFWGFSFVSIKIAVGYLGPMTLGALRFAMALVLLFFMKQKLAPGEKLHIRDIPFLAGAGLTGVTLYFFCENSGVALVTASEASIITAAIPVITVAAESAAGKIARRRGNGTVRTGKPEAPGQAVSVFFVVLRWAGAVVSMTGVVMVARVSLALSGSLPGYLYMGGACVNWVVYSFLTRPLFARCSRIYIVFWQSLAGFAGFLPFAFFELPFNRMPPAGVWAHIVFLGICCSALGYWFYARALEVLGMGVSAVFINLIPVVTAAAGFVILGDRLSPVQWAGAAMVIAGVYLAMAEPKSSRPHSMASRR
jgi:drug/metabolite transporter (DMT)-like permease